MDAILGGLVRAFSLLASFDPGLYSIISLSLKVSGLSVVIAALLGIPAGALCALGRFPGRGLLITILNTLMGLPPVVAGLVVYLFMSRSGPLGFLGLLYSPAAMVVAQTVIAFPIVAALTWSAVSSVDKRVAETAATLGAAPGAVRRRVVTEARLGVFSAVIAGFGRATAEVGAVLMVGGHYSYAKVPLGLWMQTWFGWTRNNYDKIGHFMQGFGPAIYTREIVARTSPLKRGKWLGVFSIAVPLAFSSLYEIVEWLASLTNPTDTEAFLGTQGYIWDTQTDMFWCLVGSIAALSLLVKYHNRQLATIHEEAATIQFRR